MFDDLWRQSTCGWVYGLLSGWVGSCEINKNLINLDLIQIIQFCLKISDLCRYPHLSTPQELRQFLPKMTRSVVSVHIFNIGVYEKKYF